MTYQKMYFILFNAITDSLEEIEGSNFEKAKTILRNSQIVAEEAYLDQ